MVLSSRGKSAKIKLAVLSAAVFGLGWFGYSMPAARAAIIVDWTFESHSTGATGATFSVGGPEVNPTPITASGGGVHASTASVYSFPAGNGSTHSFSSDHWAAGDYYEFDTDPVTAAVLTFDAVGSGTGPRDFKVELATGGSFFDLPGGAYSLVSSPAWSAATASTSSAESFSFDVSAFPGITGVRLFETGTLAINGTAVFGTAGTSRVDNVTLNTTPAPEPTSVGLAGAGAAFMLGRRRRRSS